MKRILLIILCLFFGHVGRSQNLDSLNRSIKSVGDSSVLLQQQNRLKNVLPKLSNPLDTLPRQISDSTVFKKNVKEVTALKESMHQKLDSINKAFANNSEVLKQKTDSVTSIFSKKIEGSLKAIDDEVNLTTEQKNLLKSKLSALDGSGIKGLNFFKDNQPSINTNITSGIPDLPSTSLPAIDNITDNASLQNVGDKVGDVGNNKSVQGAMRSIQQVDKIQSDVGRYNDQLKDLKKRAQHDSLNVEQLAEEAIKNTELLREAEGQLLEAEKLKQLQTEQLSKFRDAQKTRDQLASKKIATKFLENQNVVADYTAKVKKYKKKFDNLPDINNPPKFKPNSMKGLPFKERLFVNLTTQVLKEENISWFIAPAFLYKFSGTFAAGVGGIYRFQYTTSPKIVWEKPIYGYNAIFEVKAIKSWYLRTVWENISLYVPHTNSVDLQTRQWQNYFNIGIGKRYQISERVTGYTWTFYTINDNTNIFRSQIAIKAGIEFNLVNYHKKVIEQLTEKAARQREYLKLHGSH